MIRITACALLVSLAVLPQPSSADEGTTLWSGPVASGVDGEKPTRCSLLNTHPSKTVSGTFEVYRTGKQGVTLLGGGEFVTVSPMQITAVGMGEVPGYVFCKVILKKAASTDHENAEHIRGHMTVLDASGSVSFIPLR